MATLLTALVLVSLPVAQWAFGARAQRQAGRQRAAAVAKYRATLGRGNVSWG